MRALAIIAALMAGGCVKDLPSRPGPTPEPPTSAGCDAGAAGAFIGRPAAEAEAARAAAAAGRVRVIRPGDAVTMDYRADRLNVELDEAGIIRALRCG